MRAGGQCVILIYHHHVYGTDFNLFHFHSTRIFELENNFSQPLSSYFPLCSETSSRMRPRGHRLRSDRADGR